MSVALCKSFLLILKSEVYFFAIELYEFYVCAFWIVTLISDVVCSPFLCGSVSMEYSLTSLALLLSSTILLSYKNSSRTSDLELYPSIFL